MEYQKIGQVVFNVEKRIIGRKPTKSNLIDGSGSDNDIYLCNITQKDVVEILKEIMNIETLEHIDGKRFLMNFYGCDVELIFKINPQGRVSFRITGKNRLYGMINYVNESFNIKLDIENLFIFFDFNINAIYFKNNSDINTIF